MRKLKSRSSSGWLQHAAAAVRHLLTAATLTHGEPPLQQIGSLERYERPMPALNDYDQLLGTVQP